MLKKTYIPVILISVLDIIFAVVLIVLVLQHTYEASILTAYVTGLWCFLVALLCITGFLKTKNTAFKLFYALHAVCSIVLFIGAELGMFSSH